MINKKSALAQKFWETGKLDFPILDFHAHMHEYSAIYFPAESPEAMAHTMDRYGTQWTLFCSHLALYDPIEGEKFQVDACRRFPNHFRAYHSVMSVHTDPEKHIREVEENPDVYVGFKFLCDYYKVPLSDPRHQPYFEYLNNKGLLALLHTWGGSPFNGVDEVFKVAERYPNITFICGHSFFGDIDNGLRKTAYLPNVYYELTAIPLVRGYMDKICKFAGSERMLFGTDLPWFSTIHSVGCVFSADMTDDDRLNLFYRNGDKILRRFDWYKGIE